MITTSFHQNLFVIPYTLVMYVDFITVLFRFYCHHIDVAEVKFTWGLECFNSLACPEDIK